ncbi:DUF5606 domain-containing protein [Falsiporphyromonas endometrii]|uniref:DUF5606 domain-containing protein n=1 Tax=Falsiporphyromonas endometrii TaxID=1387297 RepID=A0ABV9K5F5_9PORP
MLKKILSISGKPGLFRLVSQGHNSIIVESLDNGRRNAVYANERIISLGDISMYVEDGDKPLGEVLQALYDLQEGKPVENAIIKGSKEEIFDLFEKILPDYDRDRVYQNDVTKLLKWYNALLRNNITEFTEPEEEKENKKEEE